jgi:tetratricopeptide (TPR) repeat protein
MRGLVLALCTLGLMPAQALAMPAGSDGSRLRAAASALDQLLVEEAAVELEALAAGHPSDPDVLFERGVLAYLRGDYAAASAQILANAVRATGVRSARERGMLARIAHETRGATEHFEEVTSTDGRYSVRFAPGPDRVMVPYALGVMRAVDAALLEELGYRHPGPIRLEIYPTTATLSQVSSLTVEEIERTGTIALCKWDRLMITTPRALVRGYPWADTVGHELVHLWLARATRDRAPVWMQEGYARFLERRWRGGAPSVALDPGSERLLRAALEGDQLLPFERLHPSIAMLPSADDAALAFAQVSTFVQTLYGRAGRAGLRRALDEVGQGVDARDAVAHASGATFAELEAAWKAELRTRPRPPDPHAEVPRLRFRRPGTPDPDDTEDLAEVEARRAMRLGNLLWERHRPAAAALEYAVAHARLPDDPRIASRYARAALAGGDAEAALRAAEPLRERFLEYEPLRALLGAAYAARGDTDRARAESLEAIRLNPFDPEPHCTLAEVGSGAGADTDAAEITNESAACASLGRSP